MRLAAIAFPAIDPIAFRVGPFAVRWYGIAYLLGFLGAYLIMRWLVGRWRLNISDDDQLTIILAAVVGVVLGGRLGYVLFYGDGYYLSNPASVLAIWDGGMSFHGGLAGILIAAAVVAFTMRIPWLTLCDIGSVGAPVGIFFGRIANFINQELWGRTTSLPWGVVFPGAGQGARHPSQLYEALLEGVLLLVVMVVLASRRDALPRGVLFGVLLTLYGDLQDRSGVCARARRPGWLPAGRAHNGAGPECTAHHRRHRTDRVVDVARPSSEGPSRDSQRARLVADGSVGLPAGSVDLEAPDALAGPQTARGRAVGAEQTRKLADEVLEFGVVVRARLRHLDHVKQVAGHASSTSRHGHATDRGDAGQLRSLPLRRPRAV